MFFLLLQGPHFPINVVSIEQFPVGAAFHDMTAFHHQNTVGIDDGGQAVSDDQRGMVFGHFPQRNEVLRRETTRKERDYLKARRTKLR